MACVPGDQAARLAAYHAGRYGADAPRVLPPRGPGGARLGSPAYGAAARVARKAAQAAARQA